MHRKGKPGGCVLVLLHTAAGERGSDEGVMAPPGVCAQRLLAHLTLFSFLLKVPDLQRPSVDTTWKTHTSGIMARHYTNARAHVQSSTPQASVGGTRRQFLLQLHTDSRAPTKSTKTGVVLTGNG